MTLRIDSRESGWFLASTWTIVAVLGSLFCFVILVAIFDLSYFDLPRSHSLAIDFRPYRLPAVLGLTFALLALVGAIAIRDRRRLQVEKLLRESEERMTLAVDAADAGLWRWDALSDNFWMTEHCRAIFVIPAETEYSLVAVAAAVNADDLPLVRESIAKAHDAGTMFEIQFRLGIGDGQERWVRCRGRTEGDQDRHMIGMSGTIVDISERMTMQAEIDSQRQSLMHLSRVGAVGELSGALAHELNQPLTAILSNAQAIQRMLKRTPVNMEELRDAIADIIEDDSRAGDVIRHLRTLLKKEVTRREPLEMAALISKVVGLARNELVTRHVIPVIKLEEDAPAVLGDAVQLQQLLLNLILNAVEAISTAGQKSGVLILTGNTVGGSNRGRYYLTISDTGPGINPETMEKLFEPFFSTKKQGLGLGLSISHAIVQDHGGSIRAENNSWGGATFHIQLPLAKGDTI